MAKPDAGRFLPLLLIAWGVVAQARAFDTGVTSDGWLLLGIGSQSWGPALGQMFGLHTIPLANALCALAWRVLGLEESLHQALNLGLYLIVGWSFFRFVRRLVGDRTVAGLAAFAWLGSASFYQVAQWPVVGMVHGVSTLLYLAGLTVVLRNVEAPRSGAIVRFGVLVLLAFFTYHPTLTLLPAGMLLVLLAGPPAEPWRACLARSRPWLVGGLLIAAVLAGVKLGLLTFGGRGVGHFPLDLETLGVRLGAVLRGLAATFTLVAPDSLGPQASWAPPAGRFFFAAAVALGGLGCVWRYGSRPVRFALGWLVLHLAIVATASPLAPRHLLLASLPGTILGAVGLLRLARRLGGSWLRRPVLGSLALLVPLLALAQRDLARADRGYARATEITRGLTRAVLESSRRNPTRAHLIDVPRRLRHEGLDLPLFLNSAGFQLELASGGRISHRGIVYFRRPEVSPSATVRGARLLIPEERAGWPPDVLAIAWETQDSKWREVK